MGPNSLRKKLVETARMLVQQDLVLGAWGNVSARIPGEPFMLITPSQMDYQIMKPEDVVVVDWEGNLVDGRWKPSVESRLHGAMYKSRIDIGAVVHTHSAYASAFAAARKPLPVVTEEAAQVIGGTVEVARYATFGTAQLAENAVKALGRKNAVLLANHGVVGVGRDLDDALRCCLITEKNAHITLMAQMLGGYVELEQDEIERLHKDFYHREGGY